MCLFSRAKSQRSSRTEDVILSTNGPSSRPYLPPTELILCFELLAGSPNCARPLPYIARPIWVTSTIKHNITACVFCTFALCARAREEVRVSKCFAICAFVRDERNWVSLWVFGSAGDPKLPQLSLLKHHLASRAPVSPYSPRLHSPLALDPCLFPPNLSTLCSLHFSVARTHKLSKYICKDCITRAVRSQVYLKSHS